MVKITLFSYKSFIMIICLSDGINVINTCEQQRVLTFAVSANSEITLDMYTWSDVPIKCNCYLWHRGSLETRLYPSLVVSRQYRCSLATCFYLNYTVCSQDQSCSHVYRTKDLDEMESGSFNDPGITTSNIWYHQILLRYVSSWSHMGTIYITCEYYNDY